METFATILHRMDTGVGLLDRFIIAIPNATMPLPQEQESAKEFMLTAPVKSIDEVYEFLDSIDINNPSNFYLDEEAKAYVYNAQFSF